MTVLDLIPQTERETLKFRLLAILVVAFAFLLRHDEVPYPPTLGLIGGYLVYNYILRSVLIPRFTSYPLLGIMLLIDVGTLLGALQLIGLDSPIFGLLPVVVVYYSLYMGYAGGGVHPGLHQPGLRHRQSRGGGGDSRPSALLLHPGTAGGLHHPAEVP